jgi:hypothetical protein
VEIKFPRAALTSGGMPKIGRTALGGWRCGKDLSVTHAAAGSGGRTHPTATQDLLNPQTGQMRKQDLQAVIITPAT